MTRHDSWSRLEAVSANSGATDEQAAKIVRRITGRAQFFARVAELMTAR